VRAGWPATRQDCGTPAVRIPQALRETISALACDRPRLASLDGCYYPRCSPPIAMKRSHTSEAASAAHAAMRGHGATGCALPSVDVIGDVPARLLFLFCAIVARAECDASRQRSSVSPSHVLGATPNLGLLVNSCSVLVLNFTRTSNQWGRDRGLHAACVV
jgi:hypothetical protein